MSGVRHFRDRPRTKAALSLQSADSVSRQYGSQSVVLSGLQDSFVCQGRGDKVLAWHGRGITQVAGKTSVSCRY